MSHQKKDWTKVETSVLRAIHADLERKVVTRKCRTIKGDVDRIKKMFVAVDAELFRRHK